MPQTGGNFFPGNHIIPEARAKSWLMSGLGCVGHKGWDRASPGLGDPSWVPPLGGPLKGNTLSLWQLAEANRNRSSLWVIDCCIKTYSKLTHLNNKYFSHLPVSGSEIQEQLSSVVPAQIPTGFFPRVGWCCSHLSLDSLEGPAHGCFSLTLWDSLQEAPEPREQQRRTARSTGPHTLVCKATYHHCCHFLLLRVKLQNLTTINKEDCAWRGSLGAVLGPGCLLTLASNDFFTNSAANTISPYCGKITLVKGNQRQDKIQKNHKVSDTGVQLLHESLKAVYLLVLGFFFHSCITEV